MQSGTSNPLAFETKLRREEARESLRCLCALLDVLDTHTLQIQWNGQLRRLRLMDVAAPSARESRSGAPTEFGRRALKHLRQSFFNDAREVQVESPGDGEFLSNGGDLLGYAVVRGENCNVRLVREGLSPCFEKYGHPLIYRSEMERAESWARREGLGIWGSGAADEWRRQKRWWQLRAGQVEGFRHAVNMGEDIFDCRMNYRDIVQHAESRARAVVFGDVSGTFEMTDGAMLLQVGSPCQPLCAYFPPELRLHGAFLAREHLGDGKPNYLYFEGTLSLEAGQPQIGIETPEQVTTHPPKTRD